MMKNVHFSPVVSQLRYPPQQIHHHSTAVTSEDHYSSTGTDACATKINRDDLSSDIQKVTVQVQNVSKPQLQKIQVSVPSSQAQAPADKVPGPEPEPYQLLEEGLFANQLRILNERRLQNSSKTVIKTESEAGTGDNGIKMEENSKINNYSGQLTNGRGNYELTEEFVNAVKKNRSANGTMNMIGSLEIVNAVDENCEMENKMIDSWSLSSAQNKNKNNSVVSSGSTGNCESDGYNLNSVNGNGKVNGNKTRNNSKSFLQWITFGKLGSGGGGDACKRKNSNGSNGKNSKSREKRSSCPPLGHPLLFGGGGIGGAVDSKVNCEVSGEGGGGGGAKVNNLNGSWSSGGEGGGVQQVISLTVDGGKADYTSDNPSKSFSSEGAPSSFGGNHQQSLSSRSTISSSSRRSDSLPPKPSPVLRRNPSNTTSSRSPPSYRNLPHLLHQSADDSEEDDLFSVNFERIIEGIFQPEEDPVVTNGKKMSINGTTSTVTTVGVVGDDSAHDEEGLQFLEGMEQKIIGLSSPPSTKAAANGGNNRIIGAIGGDVDTEEDIPLLMKDLDSSNKSPPKSKSATIPVVGKPPKPPSFSSASRNYGMRSPESSSTSTDASSRNKVQRRNYSRARDISSNNNSNGNSNGSSSLPEAMLELAQKLVRFREELHRSREHIAVTHSEAITEIHSLQHLELLQLQEQQKRQRSSSNRARATINNSTAYSGNLPPPSIRNSSTTTPFTTTAYTPPTLLQISCNDYEDKDGVDCVGGSSSSNNFPPGNSGARANSATARLLKEWDNRVSRAKEHFTKRSGGYGGGILHPPVKFPPKLYYSHQQQQQQEEQEIGVVPVGGGVKRIYCDGSKSRDPSTAAARERATPTATATTSKNSNNNQFLLETDLDGGVNGSYFSGASSNGNYGAQRYFDENGGEFVKSVQVLEGDGGGVDYGHQAPSSARFPPSSTKYFNGGDFNEDETDGLSCSKFNGKKCSNGNKAKAVKLQKKVGGSLQNLSFEGARESVEGACATVNCSEEDLYNLIGGDMATLKPGGNNGGDGDGGKEDRSRSMEFLMDSEKNAHLMPPENTLQKQQGVGTGAASGSERRMSEHELRIQRSLQKLNVPDWYTKYAPSTPSSAANTPSKTRADFGGSGTGLAGGWPGLSSSKTNSLTSLQSAGRYTGSKSGFGSGRHRTGTGGGGTGGTTPGGKTSRESLMSPSSTCSPSPSPNFERSSFTYGMPYALTRFAAARMSCGASPASLSPSPSPIGGLPLSSTSTPVSSGPASSRYHGYQKTPYLGWRSQERLSQKSLYRSPAERLAQDLLAQQKSKQSPLSTPQTPQPPPVSSLASSPATSGGGGGAYHHHHHQPPLHQSSSSSTTPPTIIQVEPHAYHQSPLPPPEIEVNRISPTKSNVTSATASDLSLNNSEESNSHKLNRVRSSIKEVSNAIVDYVNESKPLDDGMNGRASPRRGFVWLESSFVGTKPIDSPGTPDTPSTFIGRGGAASTAGGGGAGGTSHFRFDTHELSSTSGGGGRGGAAGGGGGGGGDQTESTSSTSHYTTYISRNEQMEERSNSSSVSSPTLEDILDSLLALRRPNKKFRSKQGDKGHESATSPTPPITTSTTTTTYSTASTTKPASSSIASEDITSSSHYYHTPHTYSTSISSSSAPTPPPSQAQDHTTASSMSTSTARATYGSGSSYNDDITTGSSSHYRSSRVSTSSPSKTREGSGGGSGGTPSSYQYQYQPNTTPASWLDQPPNTQQSTTTSEIYSSGTTASSITGGASIGPTESILRSSSTSKTPPSSSYRSYQSDWQDRMNQPLPDSTYSYGATSSISSGTGGDTFTSISSRYSTGGGGGGGADTQVSSPGGMSSPAVSSLHSTPTHQPYNRQSSSSTSGGTGGGGPPSSYYSSSCHSSPAKSILGGSGGGGDLTRVGDHTDSNELLYNRRSTSSLGGLGGVGVTSSSSTFKDPEEEDELAFGNPTEIYRSSAPAPINTSATSATGASTTSVAPLQGGVIINPLTGLSEYSNPPTPARHRRVSFDLDFSDKEEKSSSRSRNKEENVGGTIQCRNPKCVKTASGLEARREFKVCHNCNAYYCSRECRRAHWEKHKKTCMQSRVGAICKQIISHVKEDSYVMNQLSTTAKRGFLAKGRGTVKLFFNSPDRAERFLTGGLPELPEPLYIPHADMLPEEMGAQTFSELSDQCRNYNPDTRFVLYACVCVVNEVPTYGAVKWERELISRCSKLRLLLPRQFFEENQRHHHFPANPAHHLISSAISQSTSPGDPTAPSTNGGGALAQDASHGPSSTSASPSHRPVPIYDSVPLPTSGGVPGIGEDFPAPPPPLPPPHQNTTENNDTLILRSVPPPASHQLTPLEHKRLREVSFTNIQKHLIQRGVDIKRSYPDIFSKLCRYVEQDEPFLPVTIYPKNQETGRQFVCVIMPECSESLCSGHQHSGATNQEATIAAAVASAAAFTSSFAAFGLGGNGGGGGGNGGNRPGLQRVETINISEPGDVDDQDIGIDLK